VVPIWRTVDSDKEAVAQRASGLSRRWSGMAEAERGANPAAYSGRIGCQS
jgi:hypothetical protein